MTEAMVRLHKIDVLAKTMVANNHPSTGVYRCGHRFNQRVDLKAPSGAW